MNSADQLPDEAVALATRFFEAARHGQMDIFEQALPHGLPANLTNDKGDTLVSTMLTCSEFMLEPWISQICLINPRS